MPVRIPRRVVDNQPGLFPEGTFQGDLNEVQEVWSEDKKNLSFNISFANNRTVEGDAEPGNRRFFQMINIIRDGMSLVDIQEYNEDVHFLLQRGASLMGQLAVALGAAETTKSGDIVLEMGEFLDALQGGLYKGRSVLFQVKHRSFKRRDGTKAEAAEAVAFAPVA